jgi:hypothetical protein
VPLTAKIELIAHAIENIRNFQFCGPSDDPDEQTAVTLVTATSLFSSNGWLVPFYLNPPRPG